MTAAELLARPDDGIRRWLIRGTRREQPTEGATLTPPMTVRGRVSSRVLVRVGRFLGDWLDGQPEPRGEALSGGVGILLDRDPDTLVGVDAAYVPAEVIARQTGDSTLVIGIPTIVVEILSPSSTEASLFR